MRILSFALLAAFIATACAIEEEPLFIAGGWCDYEGATVCDDELLTILVCNGELVWEPLEDCPNGCSMDSGYAECIGGAPDNAADNDNQLPDTNDNQLPDTADTATDEDEADIEQSDQTDQSDLSVVDEDIVADDAVADVDEMDDTDLVDTTADEDTVADDAAEVEDDTTVADDAAEVDDATVADDTVDDATVSDDDSAPATIVAYDFNSGAQGWAHTAVDGFAGQTNWPYDFWEQGTRSDGASCHEGAGCWGTNLDGNYINCQRAELRSPVIDLSAYAAQTVTLWAWQSRDFWDNGTYFDGGILEFSGNGGSTWVNGCATCSGTVNIRGSSGLSYSCNNKDSFYVDDEKGFVQTTSGWVSTYFTIPAEVLTANFVMRFVYSTGVSETTTSTDPTNYSHKGWYLDDISIEAQ